MKTAVITGIYGQDGAYLAKMLSDVGYNVVGIAARRSDPGGWRLKELEVDPVVETCDVTCASCVRSVVRRHAPDEVYNLAAQSFVGASFENPESTFATNALGTINVLEAIRHEAPRARFYQASTSELFGDTEAPLLDEDSPFRPRSPYGVSKLAAHWATVNYREAYGLFACCGILFNHESPLRGHEFVTRKIANGAARALKDGSKIALGNVSAERDWGWAPDYVEAMWRMLQQAEPKEYVIATGVKHSVEEFCAAAYGFAGLEWTDHVEKSALQYRPADVRALCGDPTRAVQELGWEPTVLFDELVERMVFEELKRENVRWKDSPRRTSTG